MKQATGKVPEELDPLDIAPEYSSGELSDTGEFMMPVVREELEISKQVFATGAVRLTKIVHENPQTVIENLTSEDFQIERVPKDMIVDVAPPVRTEGDVTVISVVEEVLVVTKQLHLKEELRLSKRRSISEYRQEVTLRSEELVVERLEDNNARAAAEV